MKKVFQGIYINLLSYKQQARQEKRQQFMRAAVFALSSFLLLGGSFFISYEKKLETRKLMQINHSMKAELEKFSLSQAHLESPATVQAELIKKRHLVEQVERIQINYTGLLKEIDHLLFPGIRVAKIEVGRGYVSLQAYAYSNTETMRFISKLRNSAFIVDVDKFSSELLEENGKITFDLSLFWEEAAP